MTDPVRLSSADVVGLLSFVASFLVRTTVVFVLCRFGTYLIRSAKVRFAIWALYLVGCLGYWGGGLVSFCFADSVAAVPAGHYIGSSWNLFTLPHVWESLSSTIANTAVLLYMAGLLLLAMVGIWQRIKLHGLLRGKIEPGSELLEEAARVGALAEAPTRHVWLLPGLPSPVSKGWIRPSIYLPVEMESASRAELTSVLLHEASHLRRLDGLWDDVARLCRWLMYFHPLVHRAFTYCRIEREYACDREVLLYSDSARDVYAQTLVSFGWAQAASAAESELGIHFGATGSVLKRRIEKILCPEQPGTIVSRLTRRSSVVLLSAATALLVPSLWVSFAFGMAQMHASRVVSSARSIGRKSFVRRAVHGRTHLAATASASAEALIAPPAKAPVVSPETWPGRAQRPQYRLMPSADTPMSDPPAGMEAADRSPAESDPRYQKGGSGTVPAGAVLSDAAYALERMSVGRDHDHNHE